MTLLPSTRRGTWLLATAAWAGLSAAAWFVVPVLPRVEWRDLPDGHVVVSILPVGPTIVMHKVPGMGFPEGPVVTLNVNSGRRLDLFDTDGSLPGFQLSPDGLWVLLHDPKGIRLLDAKSGAAVAPEITDAKTAMFGDPTFSPDGSLLAYADGINGRPVIRIFDLGARQSAAVLPDAIPPVAFDHGCHRLACRAQVGEDYEGRVLDWPGGSVRWHLPVQPWDWCEFSPAGDRLFRFGFVGSKVQVCCVNLVTGQSAWELPPEGPSCLPGDKSQFFIANIADGRESVSVRDARTGQLLGRITLNPGETLAAAYDWASPTAAAVLASSQEPTDRLGQWMEKAAPWLGVHAASGRIRLLDIFTGGTICVFPGGGGEGSFLPDGSVMLERRGIIQIWDIPPRKPLTWFACAAVVIALPLAGLAWRRTRRLRREVA
jgi:hypothetical protein